MTQASKLKTTVRARAARTGESYTAARRQVLAARAGGAHPPASRVAKAPKATTATAPERDPRVPRGELSDRSALRSTGHGLDYWFEVLDRFGKTHGHQKAAEYLYSEHKVKGWHAQMITVTWERKRGLRAENQSCTGAFQVSVSRSFEAPVKAVAAFINDPKSRRLWLAGAPAALARALEDAFASGKSLEMKKPDYARMRYKWLSSVVEIRVTGKPGGKCSLVADSSDLPDAGAVPVRREAFGLALDRLRDLVKS